MHIQLSNKSPDKHDPSEACPFLQRGFTNFTHPHAYSGATVVISSSANAHVEWVKQQLTGKPRNLANIFLIAAEPSLRCSEGFDAICCQRLVTQLDGAWAGSRGSSCWCFYRPLQCVRPVRTPVEMVPGQSSCSEGPDTESDSKEMPVGKTRMLKPSLNPFPPHVYPAAGA